MLQYSVVCNVRKPYHPVHSAELVLFFCIFFQGIKEEPKMAWSMRHMQQGKMCGQGWFFSAPSPIVESQAPHLLHTCLCFTKNRKKKSVQQANFSQKFLVLFKQATMCALLKHSNLEMKHWINYHQKSLLQQALLHNEL